ncbi:patatin-like phospholipase family protein [Amphibacillus indicireducens]|uniref:Patatin-like phospholipase family protein n=2 Tax=Amphibacillus indicireducens TaxID=1076330 RepID=A0ABP7VF74_9BACI
MKIDAVFSGGGVKAFAFLGALEALENKNYQIVRAAGSSAGAIVAGLLAAGYKVNELNQIMLSKDLKVLLDSTKLEKYLPFLKWLSLYRSFGLYKGHLFEKWIEDLLADKGVYTFADLERDQLKLTVADLSIGRLVVLPDDLQQVYGLSPERFSVAKAIRMSAGLPYFFRPIKLYDQEAKKHLMVDGALLSSLPLWLFKSPDQKAIRPVIGFQLQSKEKYFTNFNINNGLQFSKTLIGTMRHAQDLRYISKHEQPNIVFLDTDHVSVADFSLSRQVREELIETGKEKTTQFLIRSF